MNIQHLKNAGEVARQYSSGGTTVLVIVDRDFIRIETSILTKGHVLNESRRVLYAHLDQSKHDYLTDQVHDAVSAVRRMIRKIDGEQDAF